MVGIKSPSDTKIKQDMLLYFFSWSKWSDREFTQGTSYLRMGLSAFNPEEEPGGCTSKKGCTSWQGTAGCYKPTVCNWSWLQLLSPLVKILLTKRKEEEKHWVSWCRARSRCKVRMRTWLAPKLGIVQIWHAVIWDDCISLRLFGYRIYFNESPHSILSF